MRIAFPKAATLWRNVALAIGGPVLLGAMLWTVSLVADATRVPSELSASARESTVLVCKDGSVEHADSTWFGRLFSDRIFRCNDWHVRGMHTAPGGAVDWPSSPRR